MGKRGPKPRRKEVLWSPELAYGVGLMASDGCLSPDGRHLIFVSKDIEQVEHVKSIFDVHANIGVSYSGRKNVSQKYNRLQWGDIVLYKFFLRTGLMPNKSLVLGALTIPDEYFFDYLRGSFDGDGCFYSYFDPRWESSFMFYLALASASKDHILWAQGRCVRLIGVKGHITTHRTSVGTGVMYYLKFAKVTLANFSRCYIQITP